MIIIGIWKIDTEGIIGSELLRHSAIPREHLQSEKSTLDFVEHTIQKDITTVEQANDLKMAVIASYKIYNQPYPSNDFLEKLEEI